MNIYIIIMKRKKNWDKQKAKDKTHSCLRCRIPLLIFTNIKLKLIISTHNFSPCEGNVCLFSETILF